MKRLLFVILTGSLTALFFFACWQEATREWTGYQRRFFHTLSNAERRGLRGGIKQIIVSDLRRIDRCTTCHVAIDQP